MSDYLNVKVELISVIAEKVDEFAQLNGITRKAAVNLILTYSIRPFLDSWNKLSVKDTEIFKESVKQLGDANDN